MTTVRSKPAMTDLWALVCGQPYIDPDDLLRAVERAACEAAPDYRTRLLIRDSLAALGRRRGMEAVLATLSVTARRAAGAMLLETFERVGFPSLERRMAEHVDPQTILKVFRELGAALDQPTQICVGGSTALILRGLLRRGTDDIDVVDQLPDALRTRYDLLEAIEARYGLKPTHFQSHYLPQGYERRLTSLGTFGRLEVSLVDALDIYVGKLFSRREKDANDLHVMQDGFPKDDITARLRSAGQRLLAEPRDRENAARNWYVLFGEDLPA